MSTWEERMAEKTEARNIIAEAEQIALEDATDPHKGHHHHLRGTAVECSCGEFFGVTCVVLPPEGFDYSSVHCEECGEPGVWKI